MNTGISKKWEPVAKSWTGNTQGIHCHWCKHMSSDEGCVFCTHPDSEFNDGDRIRSWDGEICAKKCGVFELDDFYKSDENFDKNFDKE